MFTLFTTHIFYEVIKKNMYGFYRFFIQFYKPNVKTSIKSMI